MSTILKALKKAEDEKAQNAEQPNRLLSMQRAKWVEGSSRWRTVVLALAVVIALLYKAWPFLENFFSSSASQNVVAEPTDSSEKTSVAGSQTSLPPQGSADETVPKTTEDIAKRAIDSYVSEDFVGAMTWFIELENQGFAGPVVSNNLGMTLLNQGLYSAAEEQFRKTLEKSPDLPQVQNNLALSLIKQGKLPEAQSILENMIVAETELSDAYFNLAVIYDQSLKRQEAIAMYEKYGNMADSGDELTLAVRQRLTQLKNEN